MIFAQVFCSDILDAITKDFFARKQHTPDETMHVEDIQVLPKEITILSAILTSNYSGILKADRLPWSAAFYF